MTLDTKIKSGLFLIAILYAATRAAIWLAERWLDWRTGEGHKARDDEWNDEKIDGTKIWNDLNDKFGSGK
jgi:hypothetical protein